MPAASRRLSFASNLALFWVLVAVMCAVLIGLVWFMAGANVRRQIGLARQTAVGACETVAAKKIVYLVDEESPSATDI